MRYMNIITTIHLICIIRYPKTISVLCFLKTLFDAKISMSRLEFDKPENVFFEFDRKMLTSFIDKISHVSEKKSYVEILNFEF